MSFRSPATPLQVSAALGGSTLGSDVAALSVATTPIYDEVALIAPAAAAWHYLPVANVSLWESLQFQFIPTGGAGWTLAVDFFRDHNGGKISTFTYSLPDPGGVFPVIDSIPVVGPFVQFRLMGTAAKTYWLTVVARKGGTGTPGGNNGNGILASFDNEIVAAGGILTAGCNTLCPGRAMLTVLASAAPWRVQVFGVDATGAQFLVGALDAEGRLGASQELILPPLFTNYTFVNLGAAPVTAYLGVVQQLHQ